MEVSTFFILRKFSFRLHHRLSFQSTLKPFWSEKSTKKTSKKKKRFLNKRCDTLFYIISHTFSQEQSRRALCQDKMDTKRKSSAAMGWVFSVTLWNWEDELTLVSCTAVRIDVIYLLKKLYGSYSKKLVDLDRHFVQPMAVDLNLVIKILIELCFWDAECFYEISQTDRLFVLKGV